MGEVKVFWRPRKTQRSQLYFVVVPGSIRPFPRCFLSKRVKNIHMNMCSTYRFSFMQIKLIFIWKVTHEDSFWKLHRQRETRRWLINLSKEQYRNLTRGPLLEGPEKFSHPEKRIAKSLISPLHRCFIYLLFIWSEVPFIQEFSRVYTFLFPDTGYIN